MKGILRAEVVLSEQLDGCQANAPRERDLDPIKLVKDRLKVVQESLQVRLTYRGLLPAVERVAFLHLIRKGVAEALLADNMSEFDPGKRRDEKRGQTVLKQPSEELLTTLVMRLRANQKGNDNIRVKVELNGRWF